MKRIFILVFCIVCTSAAALWAEEAVQPDLQKIEIKDGIFYYGEQLANQNKLMEIIRSVNDDQANQHLSSVDCFMVFGVICSVSGGADQPGLFHHLPSI